MSSINLTVPESILLTEEAEAFAKEKIESFERSIFGDVPVTGKTASDSANQQIREWDRERQSKLEGTDFLYIGHGRDLYSLLYDALIKGYKPTTEQLAASDGFDFMWREILDLPEEHPDVYKLLDDFGYGYEGAPATVPHVGAHIVPRTVLKEIVGTMFMRGKEYREWGWGFPEWSAND